MTQPQVQRDGNNVPFLTDIRMALPYKGTTFPTLEICLAVFNTVKQIACHSQNQISTLRWCCKLNGDPIDAADVAAVKNSHHYHPPTLTYDYLYYFKGSDYSESCGIVV
jgi:hypothetical protein